MQFIYKARTLSGKEVVGEIEASDKFEVAKILREKGLTTVFTKEKAKTHQFNLDAINKLIGGVKLREKIMFANNLSAMISAGLSLSRALSVIGRQTNNQYFKKIINDLIEKVKAGQSLSSSLGYYPNVFPPVFISMVASGEESGNLPKALTTVSEQFKKTYDLHRKIRGAMIYPIVIIGAMIIIACLMMIFLVPTLTQTFEELGVDLPLSTRIVIGSSNFLINHLLLVFLSVVTLGILFALFLKSDIGKRSWSWFVLHLPVIGGITREVNSAVIMRTISSLITSGVSMLETIKITERVAQNVYYKEALKEAETKIQTGSGLAEVFQKYEKIFPVFVVEMTLVGEETGNLPKMLLNAAEFYEEEVDQATKNLSTIIEPALMIFIGLAVGLFAISVIGPMYSLTDAIK